IPFIKPESLQAIVLTAPIVYHLSPSRQYPWPVADSPSSPMVDVGRVTEKASLINDGIRAGVRPEHAAIAPGSETPSDTDKDARRQIALKADAWNAVWRDRWAGRSAAAVQDLLVPGTRAKRRAELEAVLKAEGRTPQGWSTPLANQAQAFHDAGDALAASGKW